MEALDLDGAWVFTPEVHSDERGSFLEWFRDAEVEACLGYSMDVAQADCSISRRGVIRGIHFSAIPPGQAKFVTCVSGSVLDVVVDLRVGSPSYAHWAAMPLDDRTRRAIFIAEGLGHGFVTLSDESTMLYLCSTSYAPSREHRVHPLDPAVGIAWPPELETILSDKDAAAPSLAAARAAGILPDYAECLSHAASLRGQSQPTGRHASGVTF
ncbi:MAG TPA: dTDP-4-dehydrorhamnose 3,5-epimerase family protein [Streptosporangiaceae bacterium]|jgi:dTDP-4-dehydrorhamnose 3,5-epimerase|nr:dTDP-4-dehydrorhamnose 3,5-epimerase family protein [Streptosporangiaceae bacterium]